MSVVAETAAAAAHAVLAVALAGRLLPSARGALRFCAAFGAWTGLLSMGFFLRMVLAGPSGVVPALLEAGVALAAALALLARRVRQARPATHDVPWSALLLAAGVLAVAAFTLHVLRAPHGGWDAWALWNMRARQLYHAGPNWRGAFAGLESIPHPDYPLLLPATVARLWRCLGAEHQAVPAAVAGVFLLATAGVLTGTLAALRGPACAVLAGVALLCTRPFLVNSAWQAADVPVAFFLLLACSCVCLGARRGGVPAAGWLAAAGAWVALAAWTKNEGVLFSAAWFLALLLVFVPAAGLRATTRGLGAALLGWLPAALVLLAFKLGVAWENRHVFEGRGPTLARLATVGAEAARELAFFGKGIFPMAVLLVLLARRRAPSPGRDPAALPALFVALTVALILVGDVLVLARVHGAGEAHLKVTLPRLLLQVWPCILLALFLRYGEGPSEGQT